MRRSTAVQIPLIVTVNRQHRDEFDEMSNWGYLEYVDIRIVDDATSGPANVEAARAADGIQLRDDSETTSAIRRNSISVFEARKTSCRLPLPLGLPQRATP